jgi:hypothetical protein
MRLIKLWILVFGLILCSCNHNRGSTIANESQEEYTALSKSSMNNPESLKLITQVEKPANLSGFSKFSDN